LITTAIAVVVLGSYSAAYAAIRWREVVTLETPYAEAAGFSSYTSRSWSHHAYRFFLPAYAIEVRFRAWRMERWWRPLVELGIASDKEVAGRGTVARYWFRRGFIEGMTKQPNGWYGPFLYDPEGTNELGFHRGRYAIDRYLESRMAAAGRAAKWNWQPIPPDYEDSRLQLIADDADHAVVIASLNELRAKLRAEGFTGLIDNR
jgi:hypothetical protein